MAGNGSRFKSISTTIPKPLIPLHGEPLVRWVVENLRFTPRQRYIFVVQKEHLENYKLFSLFKMWNINFEIVVTEALTEGAACSAMLAKEYYRDNELLIANSDQFILFDKQRFLDKCNDNIDGLIMSMYAEGTKWSYIKTNDEGLVTEVAEKKPISNLGTTGLYYFKKGQIFEDAAEAMFLANDRCNNEFYLAPTYNYAIKANKQITHFNVGNTGQQMFGLGTTEDFISFRDNEVSQNLRKDLFT